MNHNPRRNPTAHLSLVLIALLAGATAQAATIFSENFEGATEGNYFTTGQTIFGTKFSVVSGSIDINTATNYSWLCTSPAGGQCLDTTGNSVGRGVIESIDLNLSPGAYQISLALLRWNDTVNGGGLQDASITVALGSAFSKTYSVDSSWTDGIVNESFTLSSPATARIRITDNSGPQVWAGAVVDNITLTNDALGAPEPQTFALFAGALAFLGIRARLHARRR